MKNRTFSEIRLSKLRPVLAVFNFALLQKLNSTSIFGGIQKILKNKGSEVHKNAFLTKVF